MIDVDSDTWMEAMQANVSPHQIRAARKAANLTQREAADLVHVSVDAWRHWEHGIRPINRTAWELFKILTGDRK